MLALWIVATLRRSYTRLCVSDGSVWGWGTRTGIGVFVGCHVGGEGRVDGWLYALIEVQRAVQKAFVLWGIVVIVGADDGVLTIAGALKPCRILAVGPCRDGRDRYELEAVERGLYDGAIAQRLGAHRWAHWRIKTLQEA